MYQYDIWYMSLCIDDRLVCRFRWACRAVGQATEPVWHIPDAVCTVLDSWWWKERPSKVCTVLFQNKINLRYCASGWFYYRHKRLYKLYISTYLYFVLPVYQCGVIYHKIPQYFYIQKFDFNFNILFTYTSFWNITHIELEDLDFKTTG